MNRFLLIVTIGVLTSGALSGCIGWYDPTDRDREAEWLQNWEEYDSELTRAIVVGGHARRLAEDVYEIRGYFVSLSSDFPASKGETVDFRAYSVDGVDAEPGQNPPVDLNPQESYTLVSPPLYLSSDVLHFTIGAGYDPIFNFHTYCPFKDASTKCEKDSIWGITSDASEHLLYDRLGAWEMPTIDIIDLACTHPPANYDMTCTFGTWNWYDLDAADAKLVARLRARDDGLFRVVQQWDIPFGAPLAHNDTREYTIELGNATEWVVNNTTNDFYVEIVAKRPNNPASMSHLMTHILVNPIAEVR